MANGFKKKSSTEFFAKAAEDAQERQDAIVESITGAPEKRKPGRPKKEPVEGEEPNIQLTCYIPESYRKRLKMLAIQEECNVSELLRRMISKGLDEAGA